MLVPLEIMCEGCQCEGTHLGEHRKGMGVSDEDLSFVGKARHWYSGLPKSQPMGLAFFAGTGGQETEEQPTQPCPIDNPWSLSLEFLKLGQETAKSSMGNKQLSQQYEFAPRTICS